MRRSEVSRKCVLEYCLLQHPNQTAFCFKLIEFQPATVPVFLPQKKKKPQTHTRRLATNSEGPSKHNTRHRRSRSAHKPQQCSGTWGENISFAKAVERQPEDHLEVASWLYVLYTSLEPDLLYDFCKKCFKKIKPHIVNVIPWSWLHRHSDQRLLMRKFWQCEKFTLWRSMAFALPSDTPVWTLACLGAGPIITGSLSHSRIPYVADCNTEDAGFTRFMVFKCRSNNSFPRITKIEAGSIVTNWIDQVTWHAAQRPVQFD